MANEYHTDMPTKQYANTLDVLSQEKSKLFSRIWNRGNIVGEEAYWNQLEPYDLSFGRSRYADTTNIEPTYGRRKVTKQDAGTAIYLDKIDEVQSLVDPKSDLARNGVYAAGRAKDKIIWNALYGTAYSGKAGGTSNAFDTGMIIDEDIGTANSGLNLEKILGGVELIMGNSVDLEDPMNELTLVISPAQWNDYLQIAKLTGSDYMNKALQDGRLAIPGIPNGQVIVSNMVPYANTANTGANVDLSGGSVAWSTGGAAIDVDAEKLRAVTLFCKSALGFGSWEDVQVKTDQRPDKNYIWQLWFQLQCGAVRLEEGKVAMIQCAETGYAD